MRLADRGGLCQLGVMTKPDPRAGGFLLSLLIVIGLVVGIAIGSPIAGAIIGTALGVVIAVLVWIITDMSALDRSAIDSVWSSSLSLCMRTFEGAIM